MSKILNFDIEEIVNGFDMSLFSGKKVLVTGATGLLGKLCVKSIINANVGASIIALVRNKQKALEIFANQNDIEFIVQDINSEISYDGQIDYIIHTASVTSSLDFVNKPVETIMTAVNGTKNILELAKKKNIKSMVFISSLEVYGSPYNENPSENDYGYIDILSPRSCYSEGKKLCETLCCSYNSEYRVPVKIARLAQTFGAGVSVDDNRVFAQFAKSVIKKENIILHTKGETKRNYCYTTDAIRGIFTILLKGENSNAYNIANKNTYITISDMAKMLENEDTKVVYQIDNQNRGYNPTVKVALNSEKLESLGWRASVDLKEMFERLILDLSEKM